MVIRLSATVSAMDTLTASHNAALAAYMASSGLTQNALALVLGTSQRWVSDRLNGKANWTLKDLDLLIEHGVPVSLPLYGSLPLESESE